MESLETVDNSHKKITKDMKRVLKFAVKRGDVKNKIFLISFNNIFQITEEAYEAVETYQQFEDLLTKFEKNKKNSKDLVKIKKISFGQ